VNPEAPAFSQINHSGISARLYLIAEALNGILANPSYYSLTEKEISLKAISQADDLIKRISKKAST